MNLEEADLRQIMTDIWTSMLGLELDHDTEVGEVDHLRHFTSCVQITGDAQVAFVVDLPEPVARAVTEAMFGMGPGEASDDDVRDAVGEVANIAGGNLKPFLEGSCKLSLPTVSEGIDHLLSIPGTVVATTLPFGTPEGPFAVRLLVPAADAHRPSVLTDAASLN